MADPWNPTGESFLRAGDVVLRGRSLNQQFERALAQERIQREQQDLLRRRLESEEAARFITPEQLPPEYRTPGMGRIPTATFPLWSESIKTGRERERAGAAATEIERFGTTRRAVPFGDVEGGAFTGQPTPGVTSIEESTDPRLQFLARMVRTGTVKPEAAIGDLMKPEEAMALPAGSKLVGKRTGRELASGGPKLKVELRPGKGDTFAVITDDAGNILGEPKPLGIGATESKSALTREDIAGALAEAGWTPTMPEYRKAYLDVARQVSVPGVGAFGAGAFVVPAPKAGAPSAPRAGGPGAPKPRIEAPLSPEEAGALGVPFGTPRSAVKGTTPLTAAQRTKMDAQAGVLGIIDTMERDLKGVWAPSGPLERFKAIPSQLWKIYGQADPQLTALHSRLEGTLALIVRALGEVGTLNEGDIKRARALQPTFAPIPDTAEVIVEKIQGLRDLVREVASRTGTRPEAMKGGGKPSGGWTIEVTK